MNFTHLTINIWGNTTLIHYKQVSGCIIIILIHKMMNICAPEVGQKIISVTFTSNHVHSVIFNQSTTNKVLVFMDTTKTKKY